MNESAQGRERSLDKEIRRRIKDDLGAILNRPEGRRFFFRLADDVCGLRHVTLPGGSPDDTLRHEGRRSVGADLLEEAQHHWPDLAAVGFGEWLALTAREQKERDLARADMAQAQPADDEAPDAD